MQKAILMMLMVEVRQLLEYNEKARHRYFEALAKLPWDEFVKNREAESIGNTDADITIIY